MSSSPRRLFVLVMWVATLTASLHATEAVTSTTADADAAERRSLIAQVRAAWRWPDVLDRPQEIRGYADKLIPLVGRLAEIERRAARQDPSLASGPLGVRDQLLAMGLLLGDARAKREVDAAAESNDPADRSIAKSIQLLAQWWLAGRDSEAEGKILAQMGLHLRDAQAGADRVTRLLIAMQERAASADIASQIESTIAIIRPAGPSAVPIIERWDARQEAKRAARLQGLINQPITLSGTKLDGGRFSTADWKGRVILVDFWATWCHACVQSLPDVDRTFSTYHRPGLEVVGICCDWNSADVQRFRAAHPFMRWPDLFEPGHEMALHPIADCFSVNAIPTYFLIDKRGTLRRVISGSGAGELGQQSGFIEQLLAER